MKLNLKTPQSQLEYILLYLFGTTTPEIKFANGSQKCLFKFNVCEFEGKFYYQSQFTDFDDMANVLPEDFRNMFMTSASGKFNCFFNDIEGLFKFIDIEYQRLRAIDMFLPTKKFHMLDDVFKETPTKTIIRKDENGNLMAFFPESPTNFGNIQYFKDCHGEASIEYYHSTKPLKTDDMEDAQNLVNQLIDLGYWPTIRQKR